MSKFLKNQDNTSQNSSEDESKSQSSDSKSESSESEDSKEEEEQVEKQRKADYYDTSSDDEGPKRVVLTEKEKRYNEMRETVAKLLEKIRIKDFNMIVNLYELLLKQLKKSKKVIAAEGYPTFFIRTVYMLENLVNSITNKDKKNFNKNNAKSFTILKQRVKKNNQQYQEEIAAFIKNPVNSDEEESSEEEESSSTESDTEEEKEDGTKIQNEVKNDEPEDLDSDSGEESDTSTTSTVSLTQQQETVRSKMTPQQRRVYWLKKVDTEKEDKIYTCKIEGCGETFKNKRSLTRHQHTHKTKEKGGQVKEEKEKMFFTEANVKKLIQEIHESRGKNQKQNLEYCRNILEWQAGKSIQQVETYLLLIPIQFEFFKGTQFRQQEWNQCFKDIEAFFKLLSSITSFEHFGEIYYNIQHQISQNPEQFCYESFYQFFRTLHSELYRVFRLLFNDMVEYQRRMSDVSLIIRLAREATEKIVDNIELRAKFGYIWLDNVSYIHDNLREELRKSARDNNHSLEGEFFKEVESKKEINQICQMIYQSQNTKLQKYALMHQIIHHSMHNRYKEANDLLLMSKISDTAQFFDQTGQQLYNKAIISIGMCAFRLGKIRKAFECIPTIFSNIKLREVIGQAAIRGSGTDPRKLIPLHKHINSKTIEQIHHISTMLLAIFELSKNPLAMEMGLVSKQFWKYFEMYIKKNYFGIPESTLDIVYAASRQMLKGDWKQCYDYVKQMDIWRIPEYQGKTQLNILRQIKEYTLRCFVFRYQNQFKCLNLTETARKFGLNIKIIKKIICKLIYSKDLNAALDYKDGQLIFYKEEATKTQTVGLSLLNLIGHQVTFNERLLDRKGGIYGFQQEEAPAFVSYTRNRRSYKKHKLNSNIKKHNQPKKFYSKF